MHRNTSAPITIPTASNPPTLPKPTKPFILGYAVIAIVLLFSVPGKAFLAVCSVTLLAYSKLEARALIEEWLKEYNQIRPHSSLGYRPPAPEAKLSLTLT